MTLSATSPPHVRKRVNYTLGMARPTTLIERSVDRPNIYLSVEYMRSTLTTFLDLNYLIPEANTCQSPIDIPKTIVFVDNRKSVWSLTTHLLQLVQDQFGGVGEFSGIIADYSTVLSQEHRDAVLYDFAAGYIRILVCTEAAGMGVDIPDVRRVIQWGVPNFINLSTLWQRIGRAGRSRETQAVFTLWLQKSICIKPVGDNLAIYRSPFQENDSTTKAIMSSIVNYEEKIDQLAGRFGSNVLHNEEETLTLIDNNDIEADIGIEELTIPKKSKDPRLRFDRGILALGSNTGCYRALFLKYFNSSPQPLTSPNHCCANCAAGEIPESIRELLCDFNPDIDPPNPGGLNDELNDQDDHDDHDDEDDHVEAEPVTESLRAPPRKRTPYYIALAALPKLQAFRKQICAEYFGVPQNSCQIGADPFLSNDEIRKISKSICGIIQPQDFCRYLKTGEHYHLAPIAPHIPDLLILCQQIAANTPKPARRRAPIAPSAASGESIVPPTRRRLPSLTPAPTRRRLPSLTPAPTRQRLPSLTPAPTRQRLPSLTPAPALIENQGSMAPPPCPNPTAPPKPTLSRVYDPIKRREYYLKAKARKQEAQALLPKINHEVSSNSNPTSKRRTHPRDDQENIPPAKVARTS